MPHKHRKEREKELRAIIKDPVERLVLERKFFEATKSLPPRSDARLLEAVLEVEYGRPVKS